MFSTPLLGWNFILIGTVLILQGIGVTSQQHTVHMCSRWGEDCNLGAVRCNSVYVVNITELYYEFSRGLLPYCVLKQCPSCCENTDKRMTGALLIGIKDLCNNVEHCQITSEIMHSDKFHWKAKILYSCIPNTKSTKTKQTTTERPPPSSTTPLNMTTTPTTDKTLSTPTINSASKPHTIQPTVLTMRSIIVSEQTSKPPQTPPSPAAATTTTNRETEQVEHEDKFPTAVAVSIPVSLIVVSIIAIIVVRFLRKRGKKTEKTSDVFNDDGGGNGHNVVAIDNRAYVGHIVDEDNEYSYVTNQHNVSEHREHSSNTTDASTNNNFAHVSRQSPAIDNTYSHITTEQSDQGNEDANYSHITGAQGNADANYSHITGAQGNADANYSNITGAKALNHYEEFGAEYHHANFLRSSDKTSGNVTDNKDGDDDEYNHTTFARTHKNNVDEDEYDHTNVSGPSVAKVDNIPRDVKMNTTKYILEDTPHPTEMTPTSKNVILTNKSKMPGVKPLKLKINSNDDKDSVNDYDGISSVNNATTKMDTFNDKIRQIDNNGDDNHTYSFARENSYVDSEHSTDEMIGIEQHDYFILEMKN